MEETRLKKAIERALADGRLSRKESEDIAAVVYTKPISEEKLKLYHELQDMVWRGEVLLED